MLCVTDNFYITYPSFALSQKYIFIGSKIIVTLNSPISIVHSCITWYKLHLFTCYMYLTIDCDVHVNSINNAFVLKNAIIVYDVCFCQLSITVLFYKSVIQTKSYQVLLCEMLEMCSWIPHIMSI